MENESKNDKDLFQCTGCGGRYTYYELKTSGMACPSCSTTFNYTWTSLGQLGEEW